jgi:glycosyltransferase involved in cell wall biosynthesis
VNYVQTLGFATQLRRALKARESRIPIILETHDVQSHLMQERNELNPWTHKPDQVQRAIRSEISLLKEADVLVHLSVDDFSFFKARLPNKPHVLAMPAIDETFVSAVKTAIPIKDAIDLLFVGQKHSPNLSALKWFFDQVWPLLADKRYNLKIVGRIETLVKEKAPQIFETFRSCFVGPVADLAPYYRSARCIIAPMVSGSGTSVKTIEALALGKPFVGTSKAFRGMPIARINETGIRAHDTPREFADAVVSVLVDGLHASVQSRAAYDSVFSIQASFTARDEAMEAAATGKL